MKICIPFVILLFSAAGCLYLSGEQTISLSDFKQELNSTSIISIVMDTRNSTSSGAVMQCGVDIAGSLGAIGKYNALGNRTFVYEGDQCVYSAVNSSIKECESLVSNSTVFYIRYNPSKNSTLFYRSKAVIEGDNGFLTDCVLSRLIG
jgi:hypothetical protein